MLWSQVTGDANEQQILSSLRVYSDRVSYMVEALRGFFNISKNWTERKPEVLQVKGILRLIISIMKVLTCDWFSTPICHIISAQSRGSHTSQRVNMLVISDWPRAAQLSDFEFVHLITLWIVLQSVQWLLLIINIKMITNTQCVHFFYLCPPLGFTTKLIWCITIGLWNNGMLEWVPLLMHLKYSIGCSTWFYDIRFCLCS